MIEGIHARAGGESPPPFIYNIDIHSWYMVHLVTNGPVTEFYVDGNLEGTGVSGNIGSSSNQNPNLVIAARRIYDNTFDGPLDEIKISNIARSVEWVDTTYNNQNDPESFSTFGLQEVGNHPPTDPMFNGPTSGNAGTTYSYTILSEDPNDDVYYYVDWGDGSVENWIGPYPSNEVQIVNHSWSGQGNYTILSRAKDGEGLMSGWTILEVSMPKNKPFNANMLFLRFLEQHPNLFPILRALLEL